MSMNESDDYKRGWYDGYNAKNKPQTPPWERKPDSLPWEIPMGPPQVTCSKCGMVFTGAMGYYCPQTNCPIQPKAT